MSNNNAKEKNQFFSKISNSMKKFTPKHLGVRKTVAFALAGVIVAGTVISVNAMGTTARIGDGENVVSVLTFNGDTDNILQSAGILCDENDLIVSNKNSSMDQCAWTGKNTFGHMLFCHHCPNTCF